MNFFPDFSAVIVGKCRGEICTGSIPQQVTRKSFTWARAGAGIAVVPRFMVAGYPELVAVSDDVSLGGDMWLVTHPEFRRDPKVRATAEFLRKAAANLR